VLETREVKGGGRSGREFEEFSSGKSVSKVWSLSVCGTKGRHGSDPLGGVFQKRDRG
jgi:hypothetical protein